MIQKIIAMLVITTVCGAASFAQVSIGLGAFTASDFGGGGEGSGDKQYYGHERESEETPYSGFGGYAFFDAAYVELNLGFYSGTMSSKWKYQSTSTWSDGIPMGSNTYSGSGEVKISGINIELLGKYPFAINNKCSIFPLLGISYPMWFLLETSGDDYVLEHAGAGDFNALWFKAGAGLDFSLTEKLYLRLEALYGYRFTNKAEDDYVKALDEWYNDSKSYPGHGLTLKLAVGYTLHGNTVKTGQSASTQKPVITSTTQKRISDSVERTTSTLVKNIPGDSTIAVLSVSSADKDTSEYVIGEFEYYLVNSGKFKVVDRRRLDQIRNEQNFQMSGEVSDDSAVLVGNMLGANIVITGEITGTGASQRLVIKALDVLTAQIIAMSREEF